MAHITEIKIDGLLGRAETIHHKLNPDVNIFFGENGGGKTTLLRILDAAMSRDGNVMQQLPVQRAEVHIFSLSKNRVIKHVWERKKKELVQPRFIFEMDDMSPADRRMLRSSVEQNHWQLTPKAEDSKFWSHIFLPTTRLYLGRDVRSAGKALTEAELDTIFVDSVNRSWLTYYSQVMKEVSSIQEEGLRNVVNYALAPKLKMTAGPVLDPSQAYERVSNFLKRQVTAESILGSKQDFLKRYKAEENLRRVVDSLYKLESKIEEAMIPIVRFLDTIAKLFSNGKTVEIEGSGLGIKKSNGEDLSIAGLSSGEKHLLKIFLTAMRAESNTLLIDEPELSMHIDWQRAFVKSVRNLNASCQLILASHSPEIMADVSDDCIFRI